MEAPRTKQTCRKSCISYDHQEMLRERVRKAARVTRNSAKKNGNQNFTKWQPNPPPPPPADAPQPDGTPVKLASQIKQMKIESDIEHMD